MNTDSFTRVISEKELKGDDRMSNEYNIKAIKKALKDDELPSFDRKYLEIYLRVVKFSNKFSKGVAELIHDD